MKRGLAILVGLVFLASSSLALALQCGCGAMMKMAQTVEKCPHLLATAAEQSSTHCDSEKSDKKDESSEPETDTHRSQCCGEISATAAVDKNGISNPLSFSLVYYPNAICKHALHSGQRIAYGKVDVPPPLSIVLFTQSFLI